MASSRLVTATPKSFSSRRVSSLGILRLLSLIHRRASAGGAPAPRRPAARTSVRPGSGYRSSAGASLQRESPSGLKLRVLTKCRPWCRFSLNLPPPYRPASHPVGSSSKGAISFDESRTSHLKRIVPAHGSCTPMVAVNSGHTPTNSSSTWRRVGCATPRLARLRLRYGSMRSQHHAAITARRSVPRRRGATRSGPTRIESGPPDVRGGPVGETVEQGGGLVPEQEQRGVLRPHEALGDRVGEEPPEPVPVAFNVEHTDRLGVNAELRPREDLEGFLERAEASGQRDEAVDERGHGGLALVHRADDAQLGEPRVRELARNERLRDDSDRFAAGLEHRVGDDAHQPDGAAAVDQPELARDQLGAEAPGRGGIGRPRAFGRAAEDADTLHSDAANSAVSAPW